MCNCGTEIETNYFFLRCQFFLGERQNLHNEIRLKDPSIVSFGENSLLNTFLYGSDSVFQNNFLRFNIP